MSLPAEVRSHHTVWVDLPGGTRTVALPAAAMPVDNIARATQANANVEQVHWVCGRYRCWWRPNYYYHPRVYVAPRVWWGPRYRYRAWHRW